MYSVPLPVSALRTRIRQEFERHRNVKKLDVTDVLITKATIDYQVRKTLLLFCLAGGGSMECHGVRHCDRGLRGFGQAQNMASS
jgi:hypothetical protein